MIEWTNVVYVGGGMVFSIIAKLAYDGSKWGKQPNGHMTEVKCDARMSKLTTDLETDRKKRERADSVLHEKINETAKVVSRVDGYLEGLQNGKGR